jgi:hypothetical protein
MALTLGFRQVGITSTFCYSLLNLTAANLYGCVVYSSKPTKPITVNFNVGIDGTQCMDQRGNSGTFTVTEAGVTCYSIGSVRNQPYDNGWDNCVVRASNWVASYSTSNGQSGTTSSYWTANYEGRDYFEMYLQNQVAGTFICGSAARCANTEHDWTYGTTPTYWV